jgi:hypothetical protein
MKINIQIIIILTVAIQFKDVEPTKAAKIFYEPTSNDSTGSGVYLSAKDFSTHHLYLGINCKNEKHTIRLNEFFNLPYITVKGKTIGL